jgi:hypothetical protein
MNDFIFDPKDKRNYESAAWMFEYWARKSFEIRGDNPIMWEWLFCAAAMRAGD